MAETTKWQDVIEVSSEQTEENKLLCQQVLNFWQLHDPALFARLAAPEVVKLRDGKVEFGVDINDWPSSNFTCDKRTQTLNLNSNQIKSSFYISKKTGLLVRPSIEEVAYHELIHGGDAALIAANQELPKNFKVFESVLIFHITARIDNMIKNGNPYALEIKKNLEEYKSAGESDNSKLRSIAFAVHNNATEYDKKTFADQVSKSDELKKADAKYNQWIEIEGSKNKLARAHEEYAVQMTDDAMRAIDPEAERGVYANGFGTGNGSKGHIISYALGTAGKMQPEDLARFEKDVQSINLIAKKLQTTFAGDIVNLNDANNEIDSLLDATSFIDKTASSGQHRIEELSDHAIETYQIGEAKPKFQANALVLVDKAEILRAEFSVLEKALGTNDKKLTMAAKIQFSKACGGFLDQAEEVSKLEKKAIYDQSGPVLEEVAAIRENRINVDEMIKDLKEKGFKTAHINGDDLQVGPFSISMKDIEPLAGDKSPPAK